MKRKIISFGLIAIDVILINVSLALAYFFRFDFNFENIPEQVSEHIIKFAIISTLIKILVFLTFKLYNSIWKYVGIYETAMIMLASILGNLLMIAYVYMIRMPVPRGVFLICLMTDIFLIAGVRFAYRLIRRIAKGEVFTFRNYKRVLIIGGGDAGSIIVKELRSHPELKSAPVAILDDDEMKIGKKLSGVPIVGSTKEVLNVVEKRQIDEVIIAMPSATRKKINDIYSSCAKTNCKVKILPSVSQLIDESVVMQKVRDVDIEDLLGREPINLDIEEVSSYLKDQVVLVTGGGGSIGSELCRQ
ncbi:MAG: polysaccharide biosynthesis protein, partial [Clostridium sp.]|nr:polysaccharide biosynthesis protein [Clostridium sp.]